ncbi:hypothetical protein [Pseudoalteromonas rhizosphaerae]|uniref:hypothetical protein n=1 Tax=Pseudoalteromonas rhizosphaerae TaxID=2518973 RepID=UPI00384E6B26
MTNIKMSVLLAEILKNKDFNKFTVMKLKDEYLNRSEKILCSSVHILTSFDHPMALTLITYSH